MPYKISSLLLMVSLSIHASHHPKSKYEEERKASKTIHHRTYEHRQTTKTPSDRAVRSRKLGSSPHTTSRTTSSHPGFLSSLFAPAGAVPSSTGAEFRIEDLSKYIHPGTQEYTAAELFAIQKSINKFEYMRTMNPTQLKEHIKRELERLRAEERSKLEILKAR